MDPKDQTTIKLTKKELLIGIYGKQSGLTPKALLSVESGVDKGKSFQLTSPELSVGRAQDNNIMLADQHVSSHHAMVHYREKGYMIEDLGSKNGTFVNGTRVEHSLIRDNDRIEMGETLLRFRDPASGGEGE